MTLVARHDTAGVALRAPYIDAAGAYHVEGTLARTGVLAYPQPDGTVRRELVRPEELFDPASMASAIGLPVTDEHVFGTGPERMLRTDEIGAVKKGTVIAVRRDGNYLVGEMVITDAALASKARAGAQKELSAGYLTPAAETPGVWTDGEAYHAVQGPRHYRGDGWIGHAAVVPLARCSQTCGAGKCSCSLRTDAATKAAGRNPMNIDITRAAIKVQKAKAKLRGRRDAVSEADVKSAMSSLQNLCVKAYPDDAAGALQAYADVMAEMEAPEEEAIEDADGLVAANPVGFTGAGNPAPMLTMNAAGGTQTRGPVAGVVTVSAVDPIAALRAEFAAKIDTLQARNDALTEAMKAPRPDAMTDERLALLDQVRTVCGADYVYAGKSNTAMRMDALEVLCPAKAPTLKGKSDTYVSEYFAVQMDTSPLVAAARQNVTGSMGLRADAAGPAGVPSVDSEDPFLRAIALGQAVNGVSRSH